jgi:hypothetical protein
MGAQAQARGGAERLEPKQACPMPNMKPSPLFRPKQLADLTIAIGLMNA